jgi:ATP-dependent Clp protease protease subunit
MESPPPGPPPSAFDARTAFLDEKTFRARTVLLFGSITDAVAADVTRRLLALDADSDAPIDVVVSSPGGHLESGDVIHDLVRFVRVIGTGWVGSAATHAFLGAPRERRFCTPNTRFLIHQPSGSTGGPASDIAIQAREIAAAKERIALVIARETGQPLERVRRDIERDYWLNAQEALEYGLVSQIIERRTALDSATSSGADRL